MLTRKEWIQANYQGALNATRGTGIFPETLLAMAIVESQDTAGDGINYPGLSATARLANNYFGIKNSAAWKGRTIVLDTPNDRDKKSTFRVYDSFEDSVKDYVKFLQENSRYTKAGVFKATDYVEQILAVAKAGYAESPTYAAVITNVADGVKKLMKDYIEPITKNNQIIPLLIIGFILSSYFIIKKMQA